MQSAEKTAQQGLSIRSRTVFYEKVPSRFTPLGEVATGEDIAGAVWYFADQAKNTTGAELVVDGGNMIQLYPRMNNTLG